VHDPSTGPTRFVQSSAAVGPTNIAGDALADRTFGFGELGMFGLHAGQTAARATVDQLGSQASGGTTDHTSEQAADSVLANAGGNPLVVGQAVATTARTDDAFLASNFVSPHSVLNFDSDAASPTFATWRNAATADSTNDVDGLKDVIVREKPTSEAGMLPSSDTQPAILIASGDSEQLTVSARTQEPVAADMVHRLIETAAEFDTQIGEMRINGSPVSLPQYVSGGSRGNRSR
jgi:hypothetical protein